MSGIILSKEDIERCERMGWVGLVRLLENGYFVDPKEVQGWIESLERTTASPAWPEAIKAEERGGLAALKTWAEKYIPEKISKQHVQYADAMLEKYTALEDLQKIRFWEGLRDYYKIEYFNALYSPRPDRRTKLYKRMQREAFRKAR
jgi:hypothetical protein